MKENDIKNMINNWHSLTLEKKEQIQENFKLNNENFKKIKFYITKEYHKFDACGPRRNLHWKIYNQCKKSLSKEDVLNTIKRGEKCVYLRKILWFLIWKQEYPKFDKNHLDGQSAFNHQIPIKETLKHIKMCKDLLFHL